MSIAPPPQARESARPPPARRANVIDQIPRIATVITFWTGFTVFVIAEYLYRATWWFHVPMSQDGVPTGQIKAVGAAHAWLHSRLQKVGIHPAQDRSAALFQLATELPAAILARTLGIHVKVAIEWQHASAGDWGSYAADVSRRPRQQPVPSHHETPDQT